MDSVLSLFSNIYTWGVLLTITIPLIVIILTEIVNRLHQRGQIRLARAIQNFRELHLPLLAVRLVMGLILGIDNINIFVRIVETLQLLVLMYSVSQFLGVVTESTKLSDEQVASDRQIDVTEPGFFLPRIWGEVLRLGTILAVLFIILRNVWGTPMDQILVALGVGSIVIGFALQDTLSSFVSGLLIAFEKPFSVGHWVKYGLHEGQVIEMNWRSVRLRTIHRDVVVVPNNLIGKDVAINFTMLEPVHAEFIYVSFSYNHPPNDVKNMLVKAAIETSGVVDTPRPHARVLDYDYDKFAIKYEVKMYIIDYKRIEFIRDDALTHIYYAAQRHQFAIPYQKTIFYQGDYAELTPTDDYPELLSRLQKIRYLSQVNIETLERLAHNASFHFYGAGEHVIKL